MGDGNRICYTEVVTPAQSILLDHKLQEYKEIPEVTREICVDLDAIRDMVIAFGKLVASYSVSDARPSSLWRYQWGADVAAARKEPPTQPAEPKRQRPYGLLPMDDMKVMGAGRRW